MTEPPAQVRVYCNAPTILTIGGGGRRMILKHTVHGRVWASRRDGRYFCDGCGKPVPVAW